MLRAITARFNARVAYALRRHAWHAWVQNVFFGRAETKAEVFARLAARRRIGVLRDAFSQW